jgi:hypothetical protein
MTPSYDAAVRFLAAHGRLLDRHRLALRRPGADPAPALAALDGYRNADGGYGWGLEPDLRAPGSQPGAALHAFEVFEEAGPATSPRAAELCDWLDGATLADGGLPFARPVADPAATAPFWAEADPAASSLHITTAVLAPAHRTARYDPAVAGHPWLARATAYALDAIARQDGPTTTLELLYGLGFLDAAVDRHAEAGPLLEKWAAAIGPTGSRPVEGGAEGEAIKALDFSPLPGRPLRDLVPADAVEAELDRLAAGQGESGGWTVDFLSYSPAAALEWQGYATVRAVTVLAANGRLDVA